jgi:hypothetical protein
MDKFPDAVLQAKDARHTQGQRRRLITAADLGAPAFHLDYHQRPISIPLEGNDLIFPLGRW